MKHASNGKTRDFLQYGSMERQGDSVLGLGFHGLGRLLVAWAIFVPVALSQARPGNVVQPGQGIGSELVSIYRQGVSPQHIERTEGPFVLFVDNRSLDLDDKITLHLGKTTTAALVEFG